MRLSDVGSERGLLAGLVKTPGKYWEISDIVQPLSFSTAIGQVLFTIIKHIVEKNPDLNHSIDLPTIVSASSELGLYNSLENDEATRYIKSVLDTPVQSENIIKFAKKIKKLEIANKAKHLAQDIYKSFDSLSGDEPIGQILGLLENPVYQFNNEINLNNHSIPALMSEGIDEYVEFLENNSRENIGIPSPFPIYNQAIGGGFRPGSVAFIAARKKVGKSFFADNISIHVARNLKIPVLNVDTELTKHGEHFPRILSLLSCVRKYDIESGKFAQDPIARKKVGEAKNVLKSIPYYYENVSGVAFEDIIAIMRRWVRYMDNKGHQIKLIVFDYLKTMRPDELARVAEFQDLGLKTSALHDFAVNNKIPVVCFGQLNRENLVASSDRISWNASSISILSRKEEEEIAELGLGAGSLKLVVEDARHGPGLETNDYINIQCNFDIAQMIENSTRFGTIHKRKSQEENENHE